MDTTEEMSPQVDVTVIDGEALVHLLPAKSGITFSTYAESVFIAYIKRCLETSSRVDVVWDKYMPESLKEGTRDSRGIGSRRKVTDKNKVPRNRSQFSCNSDNKK